MSEDTELEAYIARLNSGEVVGNLYRRYGLRFGWYALITISFANITTMSSSTMINVAIPKIMGVFSIDQESVHWLSSAFLATSTVSMIVSAWFIHTIGMRRTVALAMLTFIIGSLLGGISTNIETMIAGRMLQGVSTGIITPIGMSLVFHLFPTGRHGLAMGISTAAMVLGPALGPTIGGLLVDHLSWRWVFFICIPVSLTVLPLAALFIPPRKPEVQRKPFDWFGVILISVAITLFLTGLGSGKTTGWLSSTILVDIGMAGAALLGFLWWEKLCKNPILELRIFSFRQFAILALVSFIFGAGLFGSTYLIPLFLQIGHGWTPTESGFLLLPAGLLMGAWFPVGGRLADLLDFRWLITAGFIAFSYSSYLMASADQDTSYGALLVWIAIGRIGIGFLAPALSVSSLRCLPRELVTQGASSIPFLRQLGGAFGVSVISVILDYRTSYHADMFLAFHDTFTVIAAVFLITLIPTWFLKKETIPN